MFVWCVIKFIRWSEMQIMKMEKFHYAWKKRNEIKNKIISFTFFSDYSENQHLSNRVMNVLTQIECSFTHTHTLSGEKKEEDRNKSRNWVGNENRFKFDWQCNLRLRCWRWRQFIYSRQKKNYDMCLQNYRENLTFCV